MTEQKYLKVFILLLEQTIDLEKKLSVLRCFVHSSELFSLHTNYGFTWKEICQRKKEVWVVCGPIMQIVDL